MEEEYKMLREEIMFNINKLHWYVSGVATVGIALLAYIISSPNNIVFLSLFLAVLFILESRIFRMTKSNITISTYMEVFLEPYIENRKWETYVHFKINEDNVHDENNQKCNTFNKLIWQFLDFISGSNSVCFLISIIVMTYNCIVIWDNATLINTIFSFVNLLLTIFLGYMACINRSGHQDRDHYLSFWKNVKDQMLVQVNLSNEENI